ncbi:cyanoexosortase C [Nodosilinea sp. P-1105]|uniref:cyanoexosortase C n=1 Tax=Nodosilinea sp. P-1105 TaxID=2546229 RepID=UPI001469EA50|nr:cyanoexosortase C [Nodosilinea sp. P-1105]NMF83046.1 cyanoexosortase C [Nodosilinea sp. P-1105]
MVNLVKPLKSLSQSGISQLKVALATWHGRFILAGLTLGLVYLPTWFSQLFRRSLIHGSTALSLILVMVALGGYQLWSKRSELAQLSVLEADRTIGYVLILCSLVLFPWCRFAVWPQSILWLTALIGMAISTWGGTFFLCYPLPPLMFAATVYPQPGALARTLWQTLTPDQFLERLMAYLGSEALQWIGQPAISEGPYIAIPPSGAVHVDWGCNGFTMAVQMAIAGFFMGVFLKQNWFKTGLMMVVGAILALIFNIPRIMLLTLASVYWGEGWFEFWHGTWGGQLFTGVLFTLYYYAIMAMVSRRPKKAI